MKWYFAYSAVLLLAATAVASAVDPGPKRYDLAVFDGLGDGHRMTGSAHGRPDTVWFGGLDENGLAWEGGVWDFDTDLHGDPLHGWTTCDMTVDVGVRFYRVTEDDFADDPYAPILAPVPPATENIGQLWIGIHQDEADLRDFIAGMGYSDNQCQRALSPTYPYEGEAVSIAFNYFLHSEIDYDFTLVYLLCYDDGSVIDEHLLGRMDGVSPGGDSLGAYNWLVPQTYAGAVAQGELPPETDEIQLELRFDSDGGWSDEDGDWATPAGPLGADNISVSVGGAPVGDYDFEEGEEGWTFAICPGIGAYMGVIPEATYSDWMDAAGLQCGCNLQGNALEFIDEENSPYDPPGHPSGQREMAVSNVIYRDSTLYAPPAYGMTIAQHDQFEFMQYPAATFYNVGYMYYPFTSAQNPDPHWSPRRGPNGVWYTMDFPLCRQQIFNLTTLGGG
jgi:hypothetical protein